MVVSRCLNSSGKKCSTDIIQQMQKVNSNSHNILISSEQFDYYRPMKQIQAFFKHFDSIQIVVCLVGSLNGMDKTGGIIGRIGILHHL
eukprot:scaffold1433_cov128-Skeletonema_dohrnii-CCMP3373.AAC.12